MSKPPIEYRPEKKVHATIASDETAELVRRLKDAEAYRDRQRAKVLARVRKHRAKKRGQK